MNPDTTKALALCERVESQWRTTLNYGYPHEVQCAKDIMELATTLKDLLTNGAGESKYERLLTFLIEEANRICAEGIVSDRHLALTEECGYVYDAQGKIQYLDGPHACRYRQIQELLKGLSPQPDDEIGPDPYTFEQLARLMDECEEDAAGNGSNPHPYREIAIHLRRLQSPQGPIDYSKVPLDAAKRMQERQRRISVVTGLAGDGDSPAVTKWRKRLAEVELHLSDMPNDAVWLRERAMLTEFIQEVDGLRPHGLAGELRERIAQLGRNLATIAKETTDNNVGLAIEQMLIHDLPQLMRAAHAPKEGCDHRGEEAGTHAFEWPDPYLPRNVWNPLAPTCKKCGRSIAEILGFVPTDPAPTQEGEER